MNRKNTFKVVIAFVVVLALVLPSSAMFNSFEETINKEMSSSDIDISNNIDDLQTLDDTIDNSIKELSGSDIDWWPMFRHDLNNTGYSTSIAPDNNTVLWNNYTTGGDVSSSPAVADGKVFVGSNDYNVYCLDALDGSFIWKYVTGGTVASSPAVIDNKVFIGSCDNNLYCLDASDGSLIWNYTTDGGIHSSPAVADSKVYIGSRDDKIYCLDATTGDHIWNYTTGDDISRSPAIADGKVYIGSRDDKIYCLDDTTGDHIWNYTTSGYVTSSPAVADGNVYIGSYDHNVYCLNAITGDHIWNYTTNYYIVSSPAVADGKVYIGSCDDKIYCLDATTGDHIWNYTSGAWVVSSPAIADGKVYIGSRDDKIYCLDDTTGDHIWNYTTGDNVGSSPAVADGNVYIGSCDNKVYCFGPDITPPEITDVHATPPSQIPGGYVNITATVTDVEVDTVYLYILYPDSSVENFSITQNKTGDTYYCDRTYDQVAVHTFHIWADDTSGNTAVSADYTFEIKEDTTPPVTTCDLDGIMEGGVYIGDVTVTLTATDDMIGVNYTMYSVDRDRGEWHQYVDPFIVSEDGDHIVWFYSVDLVGNTEDTKNETFTIQFPDTEPPVTTCKLDGIMEGGVYITDVTVTLTATDDMSGVAEMFYKLNDGEWQEYSAFVVSEDGEHTVQFYSIDNAGNTEDTKSESFTIQHPCPIEIEISGGLGVNAVITNTGDIDVTDLEWSINITGGLLGLIDKQVSGTIPVIAAGDSVTAESGIFLGLGQISITVTAGCAEENVDGKQFIIFTKVG